MAADEDIWSSMTWPPGWDVRHVAETGSTNVDLVDSVLAGTAADRTVLAASHQTAGRGRLDRRWDAPAGANLLVSIVVAPIPAVAVEATHRVGVATVAATRRFVAPDTAATIGLKWPNDVLAGDRKLAGILAQRVPGCDAVVVGVGVNVWWAPDGAAALGTLSGRGDPGTPAATPIDAPGDRRVDPPRLLCALLQEIDALPTDIAPGYRDVLTTLGRWVRVELPGGAPPLSGRAVGVDAGGRLVVDVDGERHHLDVGDVVHVRTTDGENQV